MSEPGCSCGHKNAHHLSVGGCCIGTCACLVRRNAPELSETEAAIVARFEAAEAAPESYVRQHRSNDDCWCGPYAVGTLGVMTHRMGDEQ